jgi:hypothetical protein
LATPEKEAVKKFPPRREIIERSRRLSWDCFSQQTVEKTNFQKQILWVIRVDGMKDD